MYFLCFLGSRPSKSSFGVLNNQSVGEEGESEGKELGWEEGEGTITPVTKTSLLVLTYCTETRQQKDDMFPFSEDLLDV